MKKAALFLVGILFVAVIIFFLPNNKAWLDHYFAGEKKEITKVQQKQSLLLMSTQQVKDQPYVPLEDIQDKLGVIGKADLKNGTCELRFGQSVFKFLRDVPVVDHNGIYTPLPQSMIIQRSNVLLPVSFIEKVMGQRTRMNQQQSLEVLSNQVLTEKPRPIPKMNTKQLIKYLSFLHVPIKGAHVSTQNSSLPGAPRAYRKGIHEGIDWYGGDTTGVAVTKKTPILSMADGVVVRADHSYHEWSTAERQQFLSEGKKNNGQTSDYILDKLRGRSVWVQYANGVMARYVHLSGISPSILVGKKIKQGEVIGYVGNSGTSDGVKGNSKGLHLHLDLFIYGVWFWGNYTVKERRMILEQVFNPNK
ncbi:Peptidase family M23 [Seinonella peptonophila]|uniref:Peptidase family M23 n=1 Tax=Seinonella peptonophila TaxID=112248 RepID=A0A1M4V234_9BACL|nr:M23 family metallopeptidase [Seinonella peptonophila]SHE62923.1 Peptidase family M23 [Seinonella peptonophila]